MHIIDTNLVAVTFVTVEVVCTMIFLCSLHRSKFYPISKPYFDVELIRDGL